MASEDLTRETIRMVVEETLRANEHFLEQHMAACRFSDIDPKQLKANMELVNELSSWLNDIKQAKHKAFFLLLTGTLFLGGLWIIKALGWRHLAKALKELFGG